MLNVDKMANIELRLSETEKTSNWSMIDKFLFIGRSVIWSN